MLKKRIIPVLLLKGFDLFKGPGFDSWRRIGSCMPLIKVYNSRDVDELIILDIEATPQHQRPNLELITDITRECSVPVTYGGGIRNFQDAESILRGGADKVALNTILYENPQIINHIAAKFGAQSIIVSIDYKWVNGLPMSFSHCGKRDELITVMDHLQRLDPFSYGEILITNIENDGCFKGYDLKILELFKDFHRPLLLAGGASKCEDFETVFAKFPKVSALCASSIFSFTEVTPRDVKNHLKQKNIQVRL